MIDTIVDIARDAVGDTLGLVPFLFVTYLALEALEHAAGERVNAAVRRAGAAGPVVGALAGIVPQCGFSAMGATLYAGRVITLGTLVAVFLSTSDEMLPLFFAEGLDAAPLAGILAAKAVIAAVTGAVVDAAVRARRRSPRAHAALRRGLGRVGAAGPDLIDELAEAGEGAGHIHELCEREHCGCEDGAADAAGCGADGDGAPGARGGAHDHGHSHVPAPSPAAAVWHVVRSALVHTVQVTAFIFLVTLVLVAVIDTVGEPALRGFLSGNEVLAVFGAALVGLVPNCAASVVVTQLYLEGVLSFAPLMAGSLVSVGIGFLVLFRTNRSVRENLALLALLYAIGAAWGLVLAAAGL